MRIELEKLFSSKCVKSIKDKREVRKQIENVIDLRSIAT